MQCRKLGTNVSYRHGQAQNMLSDSPVEFLQWIESAVVQRVVVVVRVLRGHLEAAVA